MRFTFALFNQGQQVAVTTIRSPSRAAAFPTLMDELKRHPRTFDRIDLTAAWNDEAGTVTEYNKEA